jgi:hypothetical protein
MTPTTRDPARSAVLHQLRQSPHGMFALLDMARDPRILDLVRAHAGDAVSLFEADYARLLDDVAPHLVQLAPENQRRTRLLESLLEEGWGNAWGVYLTSRTPASRLRAHLRQFLRVVTEEGDRLYFRFYDPRVLRGVLSACTAAETTRFLGPVDQMLVEDRDGTRPCVFTPEVPDSGGAEPPAAQSTDELFVLRPPHLAALGRAAEEIFIDRAVVHLQETFPDAATPLGQPGMRGVVERGLARARAASLLSERAVVGYLELWFRYGVEFDQADPAMRELLDDGGLTEHDKLTQLEDAARASRGGP